MEATTFKISCKSSFCLEQFTLFHATQQHFYFCNFAVCCIYVLWQTFLTALYMFFALTFLWQNTINGRLRPASYYKLRINKRRSPLVHVSWNPLLNRNNGKLECGPWNGPCDICNGSASPLLRFMNSHSLCVVLTKQNTTSQEDDVRRYGSRHKWLESCTHIWWVFLAQSVAVALLCLQCNNC